MLRILKIATFDNLNGGSGSSDTANVENQPALISADDSSPDSHSDTFESKIKKIFNGVKQGLQEEAKKQSSVQKETETKKKFQNNKKPKKQCYLKYNH